MPRYLSRRHQRLMDESEQALWDAASAKSAHQSRIAKFVLNDPRSHRLWEAKHAELVRPVAEQRKRAPQVLALRDIEVRLVHKRALIDHIRDHELRGKERAKMFSALYGLKDIVDAILIEHERYVMAVSSYLSTDHLIDVMHDPLGKKLLGRYESLYAKYFELYSHVVRAQDPLLADATKPIMAESRENLAKIRLRLKSEMPDKSYADFDQQALLARSGRHEILEYMVK